MHTLLYYATVATGHTTLQILVIGKMKTCMAASLRPQCPKIAASRFTHGLQLHLHMLVPIVQLCSKSDQHTGLLERT